MKMMNKNIKLLAILLLSVFMSYGQSGIPNFPEKFDTPQVKDNYDDAEVILNSGPWRLKGVKLITKKKGISIDSDGTKGLQFRSNSKQKFVAEMKFDVAGGVSKVTFISARPAVDASCEFVLQASTDEGQRWKTVGKKVFVDHEEAREESFTVNFKVPVRFRVMKLGLGNPKDDASIKNGRLIVDNFTIYK